jgi:hypothetical protein
MGAAVAAEVAKFPGRRLKCSNRRLTREPTEVNSVDSGGARKRCSVSLATGIAVAMTDWSRQTINLVGHRSTETATFHRSSLNKTPNGQDKPPPKAVGCDEMLGSELFPNSLTAFYPHQKLF